MNQNQFSLHPWRNERNVELLKKLWAEGHSCSYIAQRIGHGLTRNAIIGKAKRLGMPDRRRHRKIDSQRPRPISQRPNFQFARATAPRGAATAAGRAATGPLPPIDPVRDIKIVASDPPEHERVSFLDLEYHHCRWPIGSLYCGRHATHGSYCRDHADRAWAGGVKRKKNSQLSDSLRGEPGRLTEKESADADGELVRGNTVHEGGEIGAAPAIHQQEQTNG